MSQERIFISYARSDGEAFAKDLRQKLIAEFGDEQIWRDRDKLEGGVGWWQQIETALENVEFMVLIATPNAMTSNIVRKEWRYARQQGVCVYPVQVPENPIDFASLPRWMSDSHFYNLSQEWNTFIHYLSEPCHSVRVPFFAVPDMPQHFIERPDEFNALVSQLLDEDHDNPVAITTSLTGAGGFGKSTLAAAICHDDEIQTAFDDGILWVTLGENPNVVGELTKLYRALTNENPAFVDAQEGASKLAEKLAERDVLMVIDDVWNSAHLRPFLKGGERCARLITTRFMNIAIGADTKHSAVDEMSTDQSVQLLLAGLETPLDKSPYMALAERLGEWALMLEIANSMLKQQMLFGSTLDHARLWVEQALQENGVKEIVSEDEEQRKQSAEGVLSASIEILDESERFRLYQLAIFRDDTSIPLTSIMTLWDLGEFNCKKLLQKFALYSFIRLDMERDIVQIHDVIREVLENKLADQLAISEAHQQLVEAYGLNEAQWSTWDNYTWQNIAYHLHHAGLHSEFKSLLLNLNYLKSKLEQPNPNAIIDDCNYFKDETGNFTDNSIRLLQSALSMSSHILNRDTAQLASQLHARLIGYREQYSEIANLLAFADSHTQAKASPDLIPMYPTSQPAGGALVRKLEGHSHYVMNAAIWDSYAISASADQSLMVWNWQTGEQIHSLHGHSNWVNDVAMQDTFALSAASDKSIIVWNWQTGEQVRTLRGHSDWVKSIVMQDEIAVSASDDHTLIVWDWQTGEQIRTLMGHTSSVNAVAIQDEIVASASDDHSVIVWNWQTGEQIRTLKGHSDWVRGVAIQDDIVVSASDDYTLMVWNWRTGKQIQTLSGHADWVRSVAIQDVFVLSASADHSLIVWNWQTGKQIHSLHGHSSAVRSVALQNAYAISASSDNSVIVWDWQTDEHVHSLQGHINWVRGVATQNAITVSASDDRTLIVWNWQRGERLRSIYGHASSVRSVAIQNGYVLSASADHSVIVWDWQTGEHIHTLDGHRDWVRNITVQGAHALSGSADNSILVWNWQSGEQVRRLLGHSASVRSVATEGSYAISASDDHTLIVWNWQTGEQVRTLHGHSASIMSVAMQDAFAVSASDDRTLMVWNWQTGELIHSLYGHSAPVRCVTIASTIAVSASDDHSIMIWNWQTGERLATFTADSPQWSVAMADGVIVSGGEDGQVHFFQPNTALKKLLGW